MHAIPSARLPLDSTWTRGWLPALLVATGVWLALGAVFADEFKFENAVYEGDQKEPISRSITYFLDDAVYDSIKDPAEIAIFERTAQQFVLVDIGRRIRTELSTKDIAAFAQQLQQLAAKNVDPVIKFCAEPSFQEKFDAANEELTLSSQWLTYQVVLAPESNQQAVDQYREFCDWHARLNSLLNPGSLPPFPRLELNSALARHRALPTQVVRKETSSKNNQVMTIRTEHRLVRPLTSTDQSHVTHLRSVLREFKSVSFEQYRKDSRKPAGR